MAFAIVTNPTPLYMDSDAVLQVSGTRVTLDTVVSTFMDGTTPEAIAQQYPSLDFVDIYALFGGFRIRYIVCYTDNLFSDVSIVEAKDDMGMTMTRHMNCSAGMNKHPVSATPSREMWDLYDINGEPQGRTIFRGEPLNEGEYHLVVQVWVKNSRGEYLIQKRADNGVWATTAGCVLAGETSRSGATRELAEELGICASPHELSKIYQDQSRYALGTAWLLERDVSDDEICIQAEEVIEIMWANQDVIRQMVDQGIFYDYGDEYFSHVFEHRKDTAEE